jgi:hypothetical protein
MDPETSAPMTDFDPFAPGAVMHMTMDGGGVMCGTDVVEDDDGDAMVFALPGVEPTVRDRDVEATRIFNEVEVTGWTPELEQAAERLCYAEAADDSETFALRNQKVEHEVIGDGEPDTYVDDELARAKAEAQAEENERAAKAAPERQELLDEYKRGSVGIRSPLAKP